MSQEYALLAGIMYGVVAGISSVIYRNCTGHTTQVYGEHDRFVPPHPSEVLAAGVLWPLVMAFGLMFGISRLSLRLLKVGPQLRREAHAAVEEAKGHALVIHDKTPEYHQERNGRLW